MVDPWRPQTGHFLFTSSTLQFVVTSVSNNRYPPMLIFVPITNSQESEQKMLFAQILVLARMKAVMPFVFPSLARVERTNSRRFCAFLLLFLKLPLGIPRSLVKVDDRVRLSMLSRLKEKSCQKDRQI